MALVLFWLAFTCYYVAFHPGGIQLPGPDPDSGKGDTHGARNPSDVVKHLSNVAANGWTDGSGGGGSF